MASPEVGGEKKTTKLPKWEAAWPGRRRERGGPGRLAGPHPERALLSRGLPEAAGWARPPELPVPEPRDTGSARGPRLPSSARTGEEVGAGAALSLLGGITQDGPRAREKPPGRSGWTSRFGANLPHPEPRRRVVLPGAEIPGVPGSAAAGLRGMGRGGENQVCLSSKSPDLAAEVRLEPKASDNRAAGLDDPSGDFLPQRSSPQGGLLSTHPCSAPPGVWGAPGPCLAMRTRAGLDGAGRPSPRAPSNPRRQHSRSHPRPPGPGHWPPPPRLHAPWRGPSERPRARGSQVSLGTGRKATKQKEQTEG